MAVQNTLWFHATVRIVCSVFVKNTTGNMVGIALNVCAVWIRMDILALISLSIHEHRISFLHLSLQILYQYLNDFSVQVFHVFGYLYS